MKLDWRLMCKVSGLWLLVSGLLFAGLWFGWVRFVQSGLPVTVVNNPYRDTPEVLFQGWFGLGRDLKNGLVKVGQTPKIIVVPHHLIAAEAVALGAKTVAQARPNEVILLSPDHFHQCKQVLCTANLKYETVAGDVLGNEKIVKSLISSGMIDNHPGLFQQEHGVFAIMPFLRKEIPEVKVTPVVISQKLDWRSQKAKLLDVFLQQLEKPGVVLIISSDFSHYLKLTDANEIDKKTEKIILSGDADAISRLRNPSQSDCPNCLWLAASLSEKLKLGQPEILWHSNSAEIGHDLSVPEATSHFVISYPEHLE